MRSRETPYERSIRRHEELRKAEAAGEVADSMEYRKALLARFHAGEMTLEQVQAELTATQRKAKRDGKKVRNDFFKRGA